MGAGRRECWEAADRRDGVGGGRGGQGGPGGSEGRVCGSVETGVSVGCTGAWWVDPVMPSVS